MAKKTILKHRRGTTAEWVEWTKNPDNILLEAEIAIEDAADGMRLIVGDGLHHTYEDFPKLYLPGYAQEIDGAVVASGYDYAEYFEWDDGNSGNEDRHGRFVAITNNTRKIHLAGPNDSVLGVTSATASIVGNWTKDKENNPNWCIVGMIGIVEVDYEGECTCGGYAMIGEGGVAVPAIGTFGYKIVKVNAAKRTIEVVLGNDSDMIARAQLDIVSLETEVDDINAKIGEVPEGKTLTELISESSYTLTEEDKAEMVAQVLASLPSAEEFSVQGLAKEEIMNVIKNILLFIWCLPQNFLGFCVWVYTRFQKAETKRYKGAWVTRWKHSTGVSLGHFIFVPQWAGEDTVKHEYGHTLDGNCLGVLYLLVIGIPSFCWAAFGGKHRLKHNVSYYDFYTEKRAELLGEVDRK